MNKTVPTISPSFSTPPANLASQRLELSASNNARPLPAPPPAPQTHALPTPSQIPIPPLSLSNSPSPYRQDDNKRDPPSSSSRNSPNDSLVDVVEALPAMRQGG
eukprot:GFKZ01012119.1.p2 GENE.GFKZ01012119.1~~GFKZ01012119.1.p2  ORF type:complete len:104 (+),score=12.89 GFKZ01012119.1:601-912(+)